MYLKLYEITYFCAAVLLGGCIVLSAIAVMTSNYLTNAGMYVHFDPNTCR